MTSNLLVDIQQFILPGILIVAMVLMLIFSTRSSKKKQKEAEEMMNKFQKGCTVMTIGGIMGKVVAINDKDNSFVIETGTAKNKTILKLSKQALYSVISESKNPNAVSEIPEEELNAEVAENYVADEYEEIETATEDYEAVEENVEE